MKPVQIESKSNIIPIEDWNSYLSDGEQFLKTATNGWEKRRKAFSTDTIYNITAMAIEKFIMAFLMKHGDLAENHTMGDLAFALERHISLPAELQKKLRYLDGFQEICDMDSARYTQPSEKETTTIVQIGHEIYNALLPYLREEVVAPQLQ